MVKQFFSERFLSDDAIQIEQSVVHIYSYIARFNWNEPYKVREQVQQLGTGFFIHEDGYLLTNAHVVNEARTVEVRMPALGRHALHADVIGFCPEFDVALLKIRPIDILFIKQQLGGIRAIPLGDSDAIRRTEPILVLGYPLGQFNLKGSTGIVSGIEPVLGTSLIQITAPINLGNSGGPLINEYGKVVGVAIAVAAEAPNIGYAIPINDIKIILSELFTPGLIRRPALGILFSYTSDSEAKFLNNPLPAGLYVNRVCANTIAEKMGIQEADMIYQVNGCEVNSYGQVLVPWSTEKVAFRDLLARIPQGSDLEIKLYRSGKPLVVKGSFDVAPDYPIRNMYPDYEPIDYEIIAGLVIMQLTDNHLHLFGHYVPWLAPYNLIENKNKNVLIVSQVLPGSQADALGSLSRGQIITKINGTVVATLDDVRKALLESVKTQFITVHTQQNIFAAFPLKQVLDETIKLSSDYKTPVCAGMTQLINMVTF